MSPPVITCTACGTELRPVAITSAGTYSACDCGRTQMTVLVDEVQLLGGGGTERAALDDCSERPGCTSSLHLSTCPER